MVELPLEYLNKLANQTVVISSLLGGFSITAVANFLVSDLTGRLAVSIMKAAIIASSAFIIAIFAFTNILMMTTPGYPLEVTSSDLKTVRIIGVIALFVGVSSLIVMLALAGWTKSTRMGWFTTIIGMITFLLVMVMLT